MGQTLTHGIYLPDEGERNCYNGLAANWSILDGAVGTVAEHTSQIAGKAPLVHTHTKSDITDFPAYGTTAGTICEGNDSRLSDARTPVAHTHTKSDVTDLLNSNFIPSANNSYDLGSSSYQWKSVYAQSYYYNGVAWGLDKGNNWLKNQSFIGEQLGNEDSANTHTCLTLYGRYDTVQSSGMLFTRMRSNNSQGGLSDTSASRLGLDVLENGVRTTNALIANIKGYNSETGLFTRCELCTTLASSRLGTSTNPWKLINDVNPGALSLPDMSSGTGVSLSAGSNSYSPPSSGWLSINLTGAISVVCGNFCHSGTDMLSVPVVKGSTYTVTVATSGMAYLFVSQGNV